MEINFQKQKIKINQYLLFILVCLLIIPSKCVKYFKSFLLYSEEILLISDEGIIIYYPSINNYTILQQSNLISSENDLDYISFAQSPPQEENYIFCRLKTYIYVFDEHLNFLGNFEVNEINNYYCVLNPYRTLDDKLAVLISFINGIQNIRILMYQIDINQGNSTFLLINNATQQIIDHETDMLQSPINKAISCQVYDMAGYASKLLDCFAVGHTSYSIVASVFNPENKLKFLKYSYNSKKIDLCSNIKSIKYGNNILIFYTDNHSYKFYYLIYNIENYEFNDLQKLSVTCDRNSYFMDIYYVSEYQEFVAFCSYESSKNIIKFDRDFNIKDKNNDNEMCHTLIDIKGDQIIYYYSSFIIYNKNDQKYYLLKSTLQDNKDVFVLMNFPEDCNERLFIEGTTNTILMIQLMNLMNLLYYHQKLHYLQLQF